MKSVQGRRDKPTWALKPLSVLSKLARAMGYLVSHTSKFLGAHCLMYVAQIENSMSMCYSHLSEETSGSGTSSKKAKAKSKLSQDPQFQAVLRELERHKLQGFPPHPKMEKLKVLLVQHFANEMLDKDENTGNQPLNESRVMVFATYRENVDEIVATLNQEQPMIRASRFVGQGTDKKGHKGYAQKEQLEVC